LTPTIRSIGMPGLVIPVRTLENLRQFGEASRIWPKAPVKLLISHTGSTFASRGLKTFSGESYTLGTNYGIFRVVGPWTKKAGVPHVLIIYPPYFVTGCFAGLGRAIPKMAGWGGAPLANSLVCLSIVFINITTHSAFAISTQSTLFCHFFCRLMAQPVFRKPKGQSPCKGKHGLAFTENLMPSSLFGSNLGAVHMSAPHFL